LDKEVIFAEDLERIFGPRKNAKPAIITETPKETSTEENGE